MAATDGSAARNGFVKDVLEGAPEGALVRRSDGVRCLASTMGNWMAGANEEAVEWLRKEIGMEKAYVKGGSGVPDVASRNGVLAVDMY